VVPPRNGVPTKPNLRAPVVACRAKQRSRADARRRRLCRWFPHFVSLFEFVGMCGERAPLWRVCGVRDCLVGFVWGYLESTRLTRFRLLRAGNPSSLLAGWFDLAEGCFVPWTYNSYLFFVGQISPCSVQSFVEAVDRNGIPRIMHACMHARTRARTHGIILLVRALSCLNIGALQRTHFVLCSHANLSLMQLHHVLVSKSSQKGT